MVCGCRGHLMRNTICQSLLKVKVCICHMMFSATCHTPRIHTSLISEYLTPLIIIFLLYRICLILLSPGCSLFHRFVTALCNNALLLTMWVCAPKKLCFCIAASAVCTPEIRTTDLNPFMYVPTFCKTLNLF
jgi:hypothetical protein